MKIINFVHFSLKLTKLSGFLPFSLSDFSVKFLDFCYSIFILLFFFLLLIIRIKKYEDLIQLGSNMSKLAMDIIVAQATCFMTSVVVFNLINRKRIKNLLKSFDSIEKKVRKVLGHRFDIKIWVRKNYHLN